MSYVHGSVEVMYQQASPLIFEKLLCIHPVQR